MCKENISPDVVAVFIFNGTRKGFVRSGYRPGHLIDENYVTTGIHNYFDKDIVKPNEKAIGTITFLSPECYPHSLREGKNISIIEGSHIVGQAMIVKVLNPLLKEDV